MVSANGNRKVDLVFEGGGVKGIGLVGALSVLIDRGYEVQNVAGTSAGAIVAALVAAGYTPAELHDILKSLDFHSFEDETWEDHIPGAGIILSALLEKGVFKGQHFLTWIQDLLAKKGIHRFGDLVASEFADGPRYRYRLRVVASDITGHQLLLLPQDAQRFGVKPDELEVAWAIRMSMSIPIFFEPWRWRAADGQEHLIVDGGLLSNFPVWIFDSAGEPPWPTFGLMLVEGEPRKQVGERLKEDQVADSSILSYAKDLVETMLEAHDRMYLQNDSFVRTISIPTLGVRTTEFDITQKRAEALYKSGQMAAKHFLATWDFKAYKALFRARQSPRRRELLANVLKDKA